eukprot:CAMPEP_0172328376 /NCGR_PEP_ID=MMETSP1058-20130122/60318_1 /TAXON_ID=83371 /ORGANISM="Detonula confervacea, Strain CCMP 353" /LENGTH=477 /DNA_ID=CAMNT_0013045489 /DNA_START=146 /DNA_END=1579 /DNA_ORIENTATION=+
MRQLHHNHVQQQRLANTAYSFSTAASDENDDPGEEISDGLEILPDLSPAMLNRIRAMKSRHDEIMKQLHEGGDQTKLAKELSSLSGIASLCEQVSEVHAERESLLELLNETESSHDEDSKEMMEEINEEVAQLDLQLQPLSQKMMKFLVPLLDPEDVEDLTSSDAVIDIRAGTGGDEACLFAAEIMSAYYATAKAGGADETGSGGKSWTIEVLSVNRTDLGGVKEASLVVSSRGGGGGGGYSDSFDATDTDPGGQDTAQLVLQKLGPYGFFQFESGVHRVQRVPVNDVKMQTSAVSVAVLPSLPDNKVAAALPPAELKIDVMRASGAGGQHVNTTESAVRVTHIPTGIMAYMQEERSQHKNKAKGLKLVAARVHQLRKEQATQDRRGARSSLMGGGDRSERIRTYNFAQDRITDHRCKVTMQGVQSWLGGGKMVRKFGPHLYKLEREERVVALEEEDEEEERKNAANGGKGKAGKKK